MEVVSHSAKALVHINGRTASTALPKILSAPYCRSQFAGMGSFISSPQPSARCEFLLSLILFFLCQASLIFKTLAYGLHLGTELQKDGEEEVHALAWHPLLEWYMIVLTIFTGVVQNAVWILLLSYDLLSGLCYWCVAQPNRALWCVESQRLSSISACTGFIEPDTCEDIFYL